MKRFATILVLLVAAVVGAAHWLDLVNFTDLSTGFALAGPIWARYAVGGAAALLALLAGLMAARRPAGLWRRSFAQGGCALACGLAFAALGGSGLLRAGGLAQTAQHLLYLVTALWLLLLAAARFSSRPSLPTASAVWGVAGSASLYLLTVSRFIFKPSGIVRVVPTLEVFSTLAALLFFTALLKASYLPGASCGRWLAITGGWAFLLCSCLELPQTICLWLVDQAGWRDILCSAALALLGLLGAVYALAAMGEEGPEPEKTPE